MDWAKAPESREQGILFPERLNEAIAGDHTVRLLDEILSRLDWTAWEAQYERRLGQPPIHPRVLASVILYGVLKRILSSRALEEALQVRLDFRWLAEGRSIDHTTLSEFRRKHGAALQKLFVQIGMVAREIGCLPLETLAFDGTRVRANNRRSGTRKQERLQELREELGKKFAELQTRSMQADTTANEILGDESAHTLPEELANVERRLARVDAALAEAERLKEADQKVPERIPLTDPQSRVTPNKEGGFAPNYTPLVTVDADSGMIVASDVISNTDEDKHLAAAIDEVQEQFGLDCAPSEMLADTLNATGDNLAQCAERGVELYAPLKGPANAGNPALRDDPSQPVPAEDIERLPTNSVKRDGETVERFDKKAFVYDQEEDCYWCPAGKRLPYANKTSEKRYRIKRVRRRYKASDEDCGVCPLREMCLRSPKVKRRMINREQHEELREAHATKMATDEAQEKYSRRRSVGERPFAVIKHHFGCRRFQRRGLAAVKQEWLWLVNAFNLQRLMSLFRSGAGPPPQHSTFSRPLNL